jgi:hypothetical protein
MRFIEVARKGDGWSAGLGRLEMRKRSHESDELHESRQEQPRINAGDTDLKE